MNQNASTPSDVTPPQRGIKSYVVRGGRMTRAQQRGLDEVLPRLGLRLEEGCRSPEAIFGRRAHSVLEIGFGMGGSLLAQATHHPEVDFIGIEVHPPGVGKLLDEADKAGLTNLRVFHEDALKVMDEALPAASIDTLQLFFPDPWPKKRHHKRRIVQPAFIERVYRLLRPGGQFHMATDWQPYAEHMREVMSEARGFENLSVQGDYVPRPDFRPQTRFETRGERLGHGVYDLIYRRVPEA
ncbi:tRNA (guanosine(46)-N7)-methyltransferase TrmB [Kushneria aurantia]|uniref:tRNA (guanine-N(7)-)-methyltransferase n=1 Tax=Kushneria aurantia TaxID=504092 RepID=A0ABV6G242_9GAMM|nr:tRNA (guanosine(46)-N7)-methyltransferase TrmB [Kushneria aurantia]